MDRKHLLGSTSLGSPPDGAAWFMKNSRGEMVEIGFWPAGAWSRPVIVAPDDLVSSETAERALDDYETTARSVHLRQFVPSLNASTAPPVSSDTKMTRLVPVGSGKPSTS